MRSTLLSALHRLGMVTGLAVVFTCSPDAESPLSTIDSSENAMAAASPEASEPVTADLYGGVSSTGLVPLTDMGSSSYKGQTGGLYPGRNTMPRYHRNHGLVAAQRIRPLNGNGVPAANGKIVLMSIGMSNAAQEWCSPTGDLPCRGGSFTGQVAQDPTVNHSTLVVVNGARPGGVAHDWIAPNLPDYDRIRTTVLAPQGFTEKQVQVIWMKMVNFGPTVAMPAPNSDAAILVTENGQILRALRQRYPNLQQVFLASRIYGGYSTHPANPEPYAYEGAFAVRMTIEAQIKQRFWGIIDPLAGDMSYPGTVPWIAWGPYFWADGTRPRSDGLIWERGDLASDGIHPSPRGELKVARMLMTFFKTEPVTRCWFLAGRSC
ncbi:MAG: hypothetical protein L0271_12050 [Gemmatimonadetes bacterium]|nr:hypothetical protein [Gemmatimonadota bacterium]